MSDALEYLVKARPQAMGHYFKFLKDAGRHLDPKTRALISVITKVHAQTQSGFKQYLRRALREGCSPVEVLDALLMAFPALGLTKVLWAVDILLQMDLPEFRLEALGAPGSWHTLGAVDQFPDETTVRVECDGRGALVRRAAEQFIVFDARCPHQMADMPAGAIDGAIVKCARHGRSFDTQSGRCIANGSEDLLRLPSRVENAVLVAYW